MKARVLVWGGTIEGVQAALDLARNGIEVHLIEEASSLHADPEETSLLFHPRLLEAANHPNITIHTNTRPVGLEAENGTIHVTVETHPRYVDSEICTSCGRCEQACPVTLLDPATGQLRKAIHRPEAGLKSIPSSCLIEKTGAAPCTAACPAGINVQGYVALISQGKLKEALDLVREAVPFPHILGRVCTHPCETACTRGKVDQPIAIASLKRYLADMAPSQYTLMPTEVVAPDAPRRVAIIGSGPAGLTCARDLVRMGHNSTVFEALPVPGGMVAVGMPRFRLPREVRQAEINAITNLGVEIRTNSPLGENLTVDDLFEQAYEAVFVASGAHKNQTLDIPGEDLEGVIDSIALLRAVNLRQPTNIGSRVVIIGGGYTAIDSARTVIRLGRRHVRIVYRRTAEEMSATAAEILETTEEGVEIEYLAAPTRILGENGKVVGIECQRMELGEPDESGRRSPIPVEGSAFVIKADTVITAIGQLPDLSIFEHGKTRLAHNGRTLAVDPVTLATNVPRVFAGGDAVSGPRSMVEAVADGRRAAVSIDRLLRGEDIAAGRTVERVKSIDVDITAVRIPPGKRRRIPVRPIRQRVRNFEEVETGYTTFMALREAKRCLNCGGCSECMECVRTCELQAVQHETGADSSLIDVSAIVIAADPADAPVPFDLSLPAVYRIRANGLAPGPRLTAASAVAGNIVADFSGRGLEISAGHIAPRFAERPATADQRRPAREPRIGVFVCRCGGNISDVMDLHRLVGDLYWRIDVAYAQEIGYACSDEGAAEIRELAQQYGLTHVVLGACACCSLDQICFSCSDRRIECKQKLLGQSSPDRLTYEFVNIREHCAWVHPNDPQAALAKAKALIRGGMARVSEQAADTPASLPVKPSCIVIGTGIAGLKTAANLATQGFEVTVVNREDVPTGSTQQQLAKELERAGGRIIECEGIDELAGYVGDFRMSVRTRSGPFTIEAGAIVIDRGTSLLEGHIPPLLQLALKRSDSVDDPVPGICVCGAEQDQVDMALELGTAAAARVAPLLRSGRTFAVQTTAVVDPLLCRGCGTCTRICRFGAPKLVEKSSGVLVAEIDTSVCRGCGTCVAHCPSCAISQLGMTDSQIFATLEAILASL